ncbi:MAG: helix-turn-helix transcriptional regulator [Chloroflexi bacterium]|nr:helix-turn-helix transcriptional regulator [Chloroflexota bacterium]
MVKSKLKILIAQREIATGEKITYESLAQEIGLSKNTLNRLAEGKTDRVDFLTLEKLCHFFHCDIADLLAYESADARAMVGGKRKHKAVRRT